MPAPHLTGAVAGIGTRAVTPDVDQLLSLDNQLCFPLYACAKEVVRRYAPLLEPLGLTYTQYIAMMVLWEQGAVSVGALGERLHLDSGTLTPLLARLEDKGMVSRTRSGSDRRSVTVSPTERGRALKARAAEVPLRMGRCLDLTAEEATELRRLLGKVLAGVSVPEGR